MNLNEINFSFGGLHCLRDFGCIWVEEGGHPIAPDIERDEYRIAGMAGSVDFGNDLPGTLLFPGALYLERDPPSQAAAQEQLRRIAAWLKEGRQPLIFDYEPGRYYIASVKGSLEWNYKGWIEGGLNLVFEAQPYARAVNETRAKVTTGGTSASIPLTLDTDKPAALGLELLCTGTAPIIGFTAAAGGKQVIFEDMSLGTGQSLLIDMEPPIGAVFSDGENALAFASRFDPLWAYEGPQTISVSLSYGTGTRGAEVTAKARGQW